MYITQKWNIRTSEMIEFILFQSVRMLTITPGQGTL